MYSTTLAQKLPLNQEVQASVEEERPKKLELKSLILYPTHTEAEYSMNVKPDTFYASTLS